MEGVFMEKFRDMANNNGAIPFDQKWCRYSGMFHMAINPSPPNNSIFPPPLPPSVPWIRHVLSPCWPFFATSLSAVLFGVCLRVPMLVLRTCLVITYWFEYWKRYACQQFTYFELMGIIFFRFLFPFCKVVLLFSRIAVNFAGSAVELHFKPADKDLPQPLLCRRKGTVLDVLVWILTHFPLSYLSGHAPCSH